MSENSKNRVGQFPERSGFICAQGWEEAFVGELLALAPDCEARSVAAGLVVCLPSPAIMRVDFIFGRQWLPGIQEIQVGSDSLKEMTDALGRTVDTVLDSSPQPWTCMFGTTDAFTLDGEIYREFGPRASLLEKKFLERMQEFRKRAMERFCPWPASEPIKSLGRAASHGSKKNVCPKIFIQVLLTGKNRFWVSIGEAHKLKTGRMVPVFWKTPSERVPNDHLAPCRSYYKLEEAWQELGTAPHPGQVCVDLGAAPGGWSWSALKRGARVIAVDAADLASHVAEHEHCEHLRDNGYAFKPERLVDWLFCDMIVRPLATLGLVERWLNEGFCRGFVVNVKFRGRDPSSILKAINDLKMRFSLDGLRVKHLFFDRSEITVMFPGHQKR